MGNSPSFYLTFTINQLNVHFCSTKCMSACLCITWPCYSSGWMLVNTLLVDLCDVMNVLFTLSWSQEDSITLISFRSVHGGWEKHAWLGDLKLDHMKNFTQISPCWLKIRESFSTLQAAAMFKVMRDTPPIPELLSHDGKDFLSCCFQRNPADRPSASVLLEHRWLKNLMGLDFTSSTQSINGIKLIVNYFFPSVSLFFLCVVSRFLKWIFN